MLVQAQTLMFENDRDVWEALDAFAQDLVHGGLVDELLRRVPVAPIGGQQFHERLPGCVDEVGAGTGLHIGIEPVSQTDLLPDPHHLLVGGDGPGAEIDIGVALDHHDVQAHLAQQIRRSGTYRSVPDDRDVISRRVIHGCLSFLVLCRR